MSSAGPTAPHDVQARKPWVAQVLQRLEFEEAFTEIENILGHGNGDPVHRDYPACGCVRNHDQGSIYNAWRRDGLPSTVVQPSENGH